jgi:hypothetical protein
MVASSSTLPYPPSSSRRSGSSSSSKGLAFRRHQPQQHDMLPVWVSHLRLHYHGWQQQLIQ